MRKLVLKMSITTDGFVCGPNGELDWFHRYSDEDGHEWMEKCLWDAGVHLMGRKSFEAMAGYWPTSSDSLAAPMNDIPKVVFTKQEGLDISKYENSWSDALVATDLTKEIAKLKQQEGKFILAHGGAGFAQDLVYNDLIDEYRLVIYPVILGKGIALFAKAQNELDLKLIHSKVYSSGIIINTFERAK
jgi:dihydrofolate reductase